MNYLAEKNLADTKLVRLYLIDSFSNGAPRQDDNAHILGLRDYTLQYKYQYLLGHCFVPSEHQNTMVQLLYIFLRLTSKVKAPRPSIAAVAGSGIGV